jgi:MerR family transcriptional regulator, light-induced transcriptional regulator
MQPAAEISTMQATRIVRAMHRVRWRIGGVQTVDTIWAVCLQSAAEVAVNERRALGHLSREPLYNTRAVVQQTEVPADTFRAWERRYGLPRPHRTPANQRLYSERDIGVIAWLRDRTSEGMTISQAISRLRIEQPYIVRPAPVVATPTVVSESSSRPHSSQLVVCLIEAVTDFDAQAADRVIDEALALYSFEAACSQVIEPALVEIGARWERGELSVSAEHFATRLITRRLSAIFNLASASVGHGTVVAACAPAEDHEVGLLILAIVLARRGWRVIYLGADVPADDLVETVGRVDADAVCLSALTAPAAERGLAAIARMHAGSGDQVTVIAGGRGFRGFEQVITSSGIQHVAGSAAENADRIAELIAACDALRPAR